MNKIKISVILMLLGFFLLISPIALFQIVYPSIHEEDFYLLADIAMKRLGYVTLAGLTTFFIGTAIALFGVTEHTLKK